MSFRQGMWKEMEGYAMLIKIDFSSDEAIYQQLCNQIILGIATAALEEGQALPSVRQMADDIGINMHTVNKAYSILRQEGFVKMDRRRGAIISVDVDALRARAQLEKDLRKLLAQARCRNMTRLELHRMVDSIYDDYE
jgi:DNA-binding transcriptional regulator YhcF (GntR family)